MCTSGQKFEPKFNGLEPKWLRTCIYFPRRSTPTIQSHLNSHDSASQCTAAILEAKFMLWGRSSEAMAFKDSSRCSNLIA